MITADKIISIVSDHFHMDSSLLGIRSRGTTLVMPRHLAMYFCRYYTHLSFSDIGNYFNRNHDTVIHAIKSVNNQCDTDKDYKRTFDDIERMVKYEKESITHLEKMMVEEVYQENDFYE